MSEKVIVFILDADGDGAERKCVLNGTCVQLSGVDTVAFDDGALCVRCSDDAAKVAKISVTAAGVISASVVTPD